MGSDFVLDLVQDWSLFLVLDIFFGDCWCLRDCQWGRFLVRICFGFDQDRSLFVRPGYGENWQSLVKGLAGGAYGRERLRVRPVLATPLVGTGSSGIGLTGTSGLASLLVGLGVWFLD